MPCSRSEGQTGEQRGVAAAPGIVEVRCRRADPYQLDVYVQPVADAKHLAEQAAVPIESIGLRLPGEVERPLRQARQAVVPTRGDCARPPRTAVRRIVRARGSAVLRLRGDQHRGRVAGSRRARTGSAARLEQNPWERDQAKSALRDAEAACTEALRLEQAGRNGAALDAWQALFGPRFAKS